MNDFQQFLNPGEEILGTIKPHKTRFVLFGIIGTILSSLVFIGFGVLMFFLGNGVDEAGNEVVLTFEPFIPMGIGVFIALTGAIGIIVSYKKTVYAYTNQRVLFRTGFIGRDFHFLEYKNIQGISVFVDFADKFFKPNTGSLIFMSSAMPMMMMGNSNNNRGNGYTFKNIPDAYNLYQKVNAAFNEGRNK